MIKIKNKLMFKQNVTKYYFKFFIENEKEKPKSQFIMIKIE